MEHPGRRRRTGWGAASRRAAVWALPGRKSLEHSAASFLEHLLLQKQSEKVLSEYWMEARYVCGQAGATLCLSPRGEQGGGGQTSALKHNLAFASSTALVMTFFTTRFFFLDQTTLV